MNYDLEIKQIIKNQNFARITDIVYDDPTEENYEALKVAINKVMIDQDDLVKNKLFGAMSQAFVIVSNA